MKKILILILSILCVCGVVGAVYTYQDYIRTSEAVTNEEPTEESTDICLHNNEIILPAVEPTCYKYGYTEGRKCVDCGEILVEQEQIVKTAHSPIVLASVEPTCSTYGLTAGSKCSVCHETIVEQKQIPMIEHTEVVIEGYAATCTETGLTDGMKCTVCNTVTLEQSVIPTIDHTQEIVEGTPSTCTVQGCTSSIVCSVCDTVLVESEVLPLAEHTPVTVAGYAATCTKTGLTDGQKCTVCNRTLVAREVIEMLPHNSVAMQPTSATCDEYGVISGNCCSSCGLVIGTANYSEPTGHVYDNFETCSKCGYVPSSVIYDSFVLGRTFGDYSFNSTGEYLETSLVIPSTYNGYNVYQIASYAVCEIDIYSIYIPNTISTIQDYAISFLPNLKTIALPYSVKTLESNWAKGCTGLTDVYVQFFDYNIPDDWAEDWKDCLPSNCNIHYMGGYSEGLEYVLHTATDTYAVYGNGTCDDSVWVVPPTYNGKPVTAVDDEAFSGNYAPNIVYLPETVSSIGQKAFMYSSIREVHFLGPVTINNFGFYGCEELTCVDFTNVISIGSYAFQDCIALKEVHFETSLVEIQNEAFENCTSLETVIFAEGAKRIHDSAFLGCTALKTLYLPDSLEHIGTHAFGNCNSLTQVYIPAGVTTMGVTYGSTNTTGTSVFFNDSDIILYCAASERPEGWSIHWNVNATDENTGEPTGYNTTYWGQERC